MNFVCVGFGVVIIVCGILFALRKMLPKAWKNMPEEEKAKVKLKPLCVNVGVMISLCGVILLVRGFCEAFAGRPFSIAMIAWFVACAWDFFFIAKSARYKDNDRR